MPVNPAQIQSVNRTYQPPEGPNPFLALLQGGVEGYFDRKQQKQQAPIDMFKSIAPGLASTGRLRPTQPGEQGIIPGMTSGNWSYNNPQVPGYEDNASIRDVQDAKVWEQLEALRDIRKGKINRLQASKEVLQLFAMSPHILALPPQEKNILMESMINRLMEGQEGTEEIRVKAKGSGQTGWIPANEYDPSIYEKI